MRMQVIIRRHKKGKIAISYQYNMTIVDAPYSASIYTIQSKLCKAMQQNKIINDCRYANLIEGSANCNVSDSRSSHMQVLPQCNILPDDVIRSMVSAMSVLIGGNVYQVNQHEHSKTELIGKQLCINQTKFNDIHQRSKAIKTFIRQYADINLRASISRAGCNLSYCPSYIKLVVLNGNKWLDVMKMSKSNSIIIDYRAVQLPYSCQDRLISLAYAVLTDVPSSAVDYIDDIIQEYQFVKEL